MSLGVRAVISHEFASISDRPYITVCFYFCSGVVLCVCVCLAAGLFVASYCPRLTVSFSSSVDPCS